MALWQRRVLAQHLPARLIDLASSRPDSRVTLLAGAEMPLFPQGTRPSSASRRPGARRLRGRLGEDAAGAGSGAVCIWRTGVTRSRRRRRPEVFDIGPRAVDGGSHTVRNTGGELPPHAANSGAEYRIVVDFAGAGVVLAVQNIGNSGVPGSIHYRISSRPWLRGDYHVVHLGAKTSSATANPRPLSSRMADKETEPKRHRPLGRWPACGSGLGRVADRMTPTSRPLYAGHRFPADLISHAVWLYFRLPAGPEHGG